MDGILSLLSSFATLSTLDATLLFGVFLRLVGCMFAFACGMLVSQIRALAGHRGIQPAQVRLHAIERDFSAPSRYVLFPSYLHLFGSLPAHAFDRAMQAMLLVGVMSGLTVAAGIGDTRVGVFVCWTIYLSFANMVQLLIYPWSVSDEIVHLAHQSASLFFLLHPFLYVSLSLSVEGITSFSR